ncbi:MAG: hypothetical protein AAB568_03515 [Patescibacteria group bacterium]
MGRGMEGGKQVDRSEDRIIRRLDEEMAEEGVKPKTSIEEEMEAQEQEELERARQQRKG